MNTVFIIRSAKNALVASLIVAMVALVSFLTFEPVVSRAVVDIFTVSQGITAEISFAASTTDVTMSPTIPGLTGGTANGATQVRVTTNSTGGYTMNIQFATGTALQGRNQGGEINNYTPTNANVPDYTFAIGGSGTAGEFAYTVRASTTSDVDQTFRSNGSNACGTGASNVADTCWYNASSTNGSTPISERIITRTTATPSSGSTSTLYFRVSIPANPSPAIPTDTYTATATLTALAV